MTAPAEPGVAVGCQHVEVELGHAEIVKRVSLDIPAAAFVGLVGPNGSGKTTLLRAIYRSLRPRAGLITVGGDDVWKLAPNDAAKRTAVVAQHSPEGFDYTVFELAAMGRTPYRGRFARENRADRALIAQALVTAGVGHLSERLFTSLSGGERQRVLIARALVQQAPFLILDEPTNHLDIHYQLDLLRRVKDLGRTVLAALHDLNLAARWCDLVYVLDEGEIVASGPPAQALAADLVSRVFHVTATAFEHPITGSHQLFFDHPAPDPPAGPQPPAAST